MPRYQIRLYKPHDLDLMELVSRHRFCLQKAAYCCLSAFVKGECFLIRIPEQRAEPLPGKKVYARTLRLSKEKEQDREIIRLLERIAPGYRNNFIKNLLRLYLMYPATGQFFSDPSELSYFAGQYQCFRKGKPLADAASFPGQEPKRKQHQKTVSEKAPVAEPEERREETGAGAEPRKEPSRSTEDPTVPEGAAGKIETKAEAPVLDARLISPEEPLPETEGEEDLTDLFSTFI